MKLDEVKTFLGENVRKEAQKYFGLKNEAWLGEVTENWFDDRKNYDGRWAVIEKRASRIGRVLDVAAGCGTFLIFGLRQGYDVWGIEPEDWKREYFRKKVLASDYPSSYLERMVAGVGEALPFGDQSFDGVTTYQTLEHVRDPARCLREMLRILKPGGFLYIKAPDYRSFFEPHYRIFFLPRMNRKLAALYLKLRGKPTLGLQTLHWVTEPDVIRYLADSPYSLDWRRTGPLSSSVQGEGRRPPQSSKGALALGWSRFVREWKMRIKGWSKIAREEKTIDLWVMKKG